MNAIQEMLRQPLVHRVGWGLVHSVWQAAGIALLLAGALWVLRRRSPQGRYVAACAALAAMVALPVVTAALMPAPPAPAPAIPAVAGVPTEPLSAAGVYPPPGPRPLPVAAEMPNVPLEPVPPLERLSRALGARLPQVVALWLLGVVGMSLWRAAGWAQVRRLRTAGAEPVGGAAAEAFAALARRLKVSRPVALMRSAAVKAPMAIGWLRCVVLLPAQAVTGLSQVQLRAILAHELAHVRRYDYLVNLCQTAVETLLFYHPAVWWVSRRIRAERENCCDDMAAAACGDRVAYARGLLAVEELQRVPAGLAVTAGGGSLLARIRRLIGAAEPRPRRSVGWLAGAVAVAVVLAVAMVPPLARWSGRGSSGSADAAPPADLRRPDQPPERARDPRPFGGPGFGTETDRAAWKALRQGVARVEFRGVPFAEVIQFLRDLSNVKIRVKWNVLRAADVDEKSPVNVKLVRVSLEKTLRTVLDDVGGPKRLGFVVDDGVITISTREDLSRRTVTRVYDIRDLIVSIPQGSAVAPALGLAGPGDVKGVEPPTKGPSRQEMINTIVELIQQTIAPDTWKGEPPPGRLREMSGQLIVTQTPEHHRSLIRLLTQLREARSPQVAVQVHVIERGDVGLLKGLGPEASGKPGAAPGPIGVRGDLLRAMFLSEEQAKSLLSKAKGRALKVPRVVSFSGQRPFVAMTSRQTVSLPVLGDRSRRARVPYRAGTVVSLEPTIRADRRHVTLTVDVRHARLTAGEDGAAREVIAGALCTVDIPDGGTLLVAMPARQHVPALKATEDPRTGESGYELVRTPVAGQQAEKGSAVVLLFQPTIIAQREREEPAHLPRDAGPGAGRRPSGQGGAVAVAESPPPPAEEAHAPTPRPETRPAGPTLKTALLLSESDTDLSQEPPPGARSPAKEDLAGEVRGDLIAPGDLLRISVLHLLAEGVEAVLERQVSKDGLIDLPLLKDRAKVQGLTAEQARKQIADLYAQAAVIKDPQVSVRIVSQPGRAFSILGGVARPGAYAIPGKGLRLLEALALAGDVSQANIRYIYVIRAGEDGLIAIDLAKLTAGDPRLNVAIRPGDAICVPRVVAGEFYVTGDVLRPGVYSLTGRRITVKQALAAAGKAAGKPWPEKAVLIRRVSDEHEQMQPLKLAAMFRGQEPDLFLRPNDLIAVGIDAPSKDRVTILKRLAVASPRRPQPPGTPALPLVTTRPAGAGEVYIMGLVQRPGVYTADGRKMTLLRLLAAAGFQANAHKGAVATVIRRSQDEKEQRPTFDLDAVLGGTQPDPPLRPGDVVLIRPGDGGGAADTRRPDDDPQLRALKLQVTDLEVRLANVRAKLGPQHRSAKSLEGLLAAMRERIAAREAELARSVGPAKAAVGPAVEAAPARTVVVYQVRQAVAAVKRRPDVETDVQALQWLADLIRQELALGPQAAIAFDVKTVALIVSATPAEQRAVSDLLEGLPGQVGKIIDVGARFIRLSAEDDKRLRTWMLARGRGFVGTEDSFQNEAGRPIKQGSFVVDAETFEALVQRAKGSKSAEVLTAPKMHMLSYSPAELRVGHRVPLKLFPGGEVVQVDAGTFLKARAHVGADGRTVVLSVEPEVRKLIPGEPPLEDRAAAEGRASVPADHALLLRLPVRRYRITGFAPVRAAEPSKPAEIVLHRKLADPTAEPEAYVYVLIKPSLAKP